MLPKISFGSVLLRPSRLAFNASCKLSSERKLISVTENESKKTATVVMQRLPANSLNLELLEELTSTIKTLEEKRFRGMILTSSSPTIFSAGLDITEMYKPEKERFKKFWVALQTMWKTLYVSPLITIAAINGHAPAGGFLISMSCDHSIMVKSRSTIGLNETQLGIVAPNWFSQVLINTSGFRNAEHALKLGQLFTAEEALKLQMIHEIVDSPAELPEKAEVAMDKFLKIPASAFQVTKISLRKPFVDKLVSYEKKELEETQNFVFQDSVQMLLGKYIESLKGKKK